MSTRCKACGKPNQCRHSRHAVAMLPKLVKALRAMLDAYAPRADFSQENRFRLHSAVLAAHDGIIEAEQEPAGND